MADEPRGDLAEVVDRAWDAWLRDGAIDPALERRDPALARTLRRVATLEPAPAPSPAFAARLQTELLGPPAPALRLRAATPREFQTALPWTRNRPLAALGRRAGTGLATAALVLLTLVGALLSWRTSVGPNLAPGVRADTIVLQGVFTDLPPYASWAGIVRTTLPPGAEWSVGTRDDTGVGPLLVRVESGSLTVQSDGPLTFSRAGAVSAATAQPKERVVLRPDDRAFAPSGVSTRLRNGGSEPTTFLVAGITADHEPFALLDQAALIEEHLHTPLAAPVAVAARRITLDAGAAVPLAAWPGLRMLGVESGRVEAVTPSATGTPTALPIANATTNDPFFTPETVLRNVGDEPATLWALTIQPADPMSAPAASPP